MLLGLLNVEEKMMTVIELELLEKSEEVKDLKAEVLRLQGVIIQTMNELNELKTHLEKE
jgi:hypothetical protein